jgi:catechol 2,3-dioxygenase-like lactoylglutathione lyase family enzyme
MPVTRINHVSFTVRDLDRTVEFYEHVLGFRLLGRKRRNYPGLAKGLFGTSLQTTGDADILIANMQAPGLEVEFIQYTQPASQPYGGDPSTAGSAHLALDCSDIHAERSRLEGLGVHFNSREIVIDDGTGHPWQWCYFRDPDGICVELVEGG